MAKDKKPDFMIDKEPAQKIITALQKRKGFDWWWQGINNEFQDEILEEIAEIIDEHIEFNWR